MKKQISTRWMGLIAVELLILIVSVPVEPVKVITVIAGEQMELLVGAADPSEVDAGTVEWSELRSGDNSKAWPLTQGGICHQEWPTSERVLCTCDEQFNECAPNAEVYVDDSGVLHTPATPTWHGVLNVKLDAKQWGETSNELIITVKEKVLPIVSWGTNPSPDSPYAPTMVPIYITTNEPVQSCEYQISGVASQAWTPIPELIMVTFQDGESWNPNDDMAFAADYSIPTGGATGTYTVKARCTDFADNVGSALDKTFDIELLVDESCGAMNDKTACEENSCKWLLGDPGEGGCVEASSTECFDVSKCICPMAACQATPGCTAHYELGDNWCGGTAW